jgi:hypothetical protein
MAILLMGYGLLAQQVDPGLVRLKDRLDSISGFKASLRMEVDISFVNMPVKHAYVVYEKGAPVRITSEDFVMIPKRGLDLTLNELFKYPFMTLNLGVVSLDGRKCEQIKIIPTTDDSDYSIATLWMDPESLQILKSQISTKKNGVYDIIYGYTGPGELLPSEIRVDLSVSGIKVPLRFLGKDTRIDQDKRKEQEEEKGSIIIQLTDYHISRL